MVLHYHIYGLMIFSIFFFPHIHVFGGPFSHCNIFLDWQKKTSFRGYFRMMHVSDLLHKGCVADPFLPAPVSTLTYSALEETYAETYSLNSETAACALWWGLPVLDAISAIIMLFLSFIASGLLSYSLTESLIFSYSYTSFFTPFRWSKPLWFSSETPSERHSGVLTSRALSNHRQLPMLAGCQNFKAALARIFSLFHRDWSPGKPCWWLRQLCACWREILSHTALAGQGMFSERGCCSLWSFLCSNRSSSHRALCPFSYPSQLPVPDLPLHLLTLLHCWEFLSCLGHGEVQRAHLDVAVWGRQGEGAEGWSKRAWEQVHCG